MIVEASAAGHLVVVAKDLVPIVHDAPARPAVPAPIRHAPWVGERGGEERLRGRGAPIHQQCGAGGVEQADASHVHALAARGREMPDAHVQPEAAQRGELGDQAADVGVAINGLRAAPGRIAATGVQAGGERGDLVLEGVGDRGEVTVVGADQRRIGLVVQVVWKGEGGGVLAGHRASVRPHPGLAASPPTSYTLKVEARFGAAIYEDADICCVHASLNAP